MKDVNLETIIDMQSWSRTWPLNGYCLIRAKPKLLRRRKGVYESFSSRRKSHHRYAVVVLVPIDIVSTLRAAPSTGRVVQLCGEREGEWCDSIAAWIWTGCC